MLAATVVLLALAAGPEPAAPEPTVGSVAQGVLDANAPGVIDRWRAALKNARPDVRAAAARAVNVTGVPSLGPDIAAALKQETVDDVAAELIGAAVTLRAVDDASLVSAVHGPRQARVLAARLLRARGPTAVAAFLTPLRKAGFQVTDPDFGALIGEAGLRESLAREALEQNDWELWRTVLSVRKGTPPLLSETLLAAGLRAPGQEFREQTLWYLARNAGHSTDPAALRRLLATEVPPGASLGEMLARELTGRALGTPPRDVPGWLDSFKSPAQVMPQVELLDPEMQGRFTKRELAALRGRLGVKELPRNPPSPPAPPSEAAMWVMTGFPRGYRSAVMEATGCQPATDVVGAAEVQWKPDGRLRSMALLPDRLSQGCRDAFTILAASSLVPDSRQEVPSTPAALFGVFDPELLACQDEPAPAAAPRSVGGPGHIDPPKKVRTMAPAYPEAAKQGGIQGVVLMEVVISTSGCVQDLRLVHTVHPSLAWPAMKAVLQWRYSPTLLDGVAVPVFMTITVNFRLS